MPAFEPIYSFSIKEVMSRLEHAADRAGDSLTLQAERWHGWLTWQTGITLPLDLFTKYVEASDYRNAMTAYGTPEDQDFARAAVQNYLAPLTAIVYSHAGLPAKAVV